MLLKTGSVTIKDTNQYITKGNLPECWSTLLRNIESASGATTFPWQFLNGCSPSKKKNELCLLNSHRDTNNELDESLSGRSDSRIQQITPAEAG